MAYILEFHRRLAKLHEGQLCQSVQHKSACMGIYDCMQEAAPTPTCNSDDPRCTGTGNSFRHCTRPRAVPRICTAIASTACAGLPLHKTAFPSGHCNNRSALHGACTKPLPSSWTHLCAPDHPLTGLQGPLHAMQLRMVDAVAHPKVSQPSCKH